MIILSYIFFVLVLVLLVSFKKYLFIPVTFVICCLNLIVEKLTNPSMQGDTWRLLDFQRVWPEYLLTFFLILIILINNIKVTQYKYTNILIIWAIFTLLSTLFSTDIYRSFLIFPIAFINPFLCYLITIKFYKKHFKVNDSLIINNLIIGLIIFNTIGLILFTMSGGFIYFLSADFFFVRSSMGILLGNAGIQIISLFIPLLLFSQNSILKYSLFSLILFSLIIGSSRGNYIVISVAIIFYYFDIIKKKRSSIIKATSILILIISLINSFFPEYVEFISERFKFKKEGSIIDEAERGEIWSNSIELIKKYPISGIGLGNYHLFDSSGFSDAHNLFLSITTETGILNIFLFIILIFKVFFSRVKSLNHRYLKFGLFIFLLSSLTGNQFFIVSGFVTGISAVLFAIFLALDTIFSEKNIYDIKSSN